MCVYIYIYIYIHTYVHTYIHTCIHTYNVSDINNEHDNDNDNNDNNDNNNITTEKLALGAGPARPHGRAVGRAGLACGLQHRHCAAQARPAARRGRQIEIGGVGLG